LSQRLETIKFLLQRADGSGKEISYLKVEGSETKQQQSSIISKPTQKKQGALILVTA